MSLRGLPLDPVAEGHLRALVSAGVAEGREIEFKRELSGRSDAEGREFLSDVCSLANSGGGDVLYGVEEAGGVAVGVPGVDLPDADAEKLRLDSIARGGLDPRVVGLDVRAVPIAGGRSVVVLRVPRSFARPHTVDYRGASASTPAASPASSRWTWRRSGPPSWAPSHSTRGCAPSVPTGLPPWPPTAAPCPCGVRASSCCTPCRSPPSTRPRRRSTWAKPTAVTGTCSTSGARPGTAHATTLTGCSGRQPRAAGHPGAYAQLFRIGAVEVADAVALADREGRHPGTIAGRAFERRAVEPLAKHLALQRSLGVDPPVLAMLSFVGVRGYGMLFPPPRSDEGVVVDRDDLVVPEVLFEGYETDTQGVARRMRPAIDAVWNACGFPRSPNYDGDGRWHRMGL